MGIGNASALLDEDPKASYVLRSCSKAGFSVVKTADMVNADYKGSLMSVQSLSAAHRLLSSLVKHVTDHDNKRTLLGALSVRRDFQERFVEQMSGKLNREDEYQIDLANGVQSALLNMARTSTSPYITLTQVTAGIINQVLSAINKSLDEHERRIKAS